MALRKMFSFMAEERRRLILAFFVMIFHSAISMLTPFLIGYTIDHFIQHKDYGGLFSMAGWLLLIYLVWALTSYLQTMLMGTVGQHMLFNLRNKLFQKIQALPLAFFNQNKTGDLISRINNDTDKVNQFFSQSLMQFVSSLFMMTGALVFLLSIHFRLGGASLLPAVAILIFVLLVSPWVKRKNAKSLKTSGLLSAEVAEGLENFRTVIVFNRREHFRKSFRTVNEQNYKDAVWSGIANNIFPPFFTLFSNLAQLIVLALGIYFIVQGSFTIGLLISFIAYVQNFYQPLRQMAALWASFQTAMAAWDRIAVIFDLEGNLPQLPETGAPPGPTPTLEFQSVSFAYPGGKPVLHEVSFQLEAGKTYALVGPTGGGKTTMASLIARLYDPSSGRVLLEGRDLRSWPDAERSTYIGFILQEPFLFSGSLKENILYGHPEAEALLKKGLPELLHTSGLDDLMQRFENGLDTEVQGNNLSLGQKQIISFIRAVLRKPRLLILDEATANIDTVTEKLLENILSALPADTTRVIIAHRLNTIENADQIYFVNEGLATPAGSLDNAIKLLMERKGAS